MKLSSPQMRFPAYVAVLAVISSLSLATVFHYQKICLARHPVMDLSAARASYAQLPLSFQENMGQTDSRVRFVSRGPGYEMFLTPEEAVLALRHPTRQAATSARDRARVLRRSRTQHSSEPSHTASVVRIRFVGANFSPDVSGADKLPGRVDYFTGNNPRNWHMNVPSYSRVQYHALYPGVDLVFYGNQRQLEYDFVVAPEADPKSIALEVAGASSLHTDADGNLLIGVQDGEVELHRPVVYQQVRGARREVAAAYALAGANRVTFAVSNYDRSQPLVIDPVLNYSTYLGGSSDDSGNAIAVDASGDACITGATFSTDFPNTAPNTLPPDTAGANTAAFGNVFVTVLNPAGTAEIYSAYLSGDGVGSNTNPNAFETGAGIAVDSSGKVYITGTTFSDDFPVTAATAFIPTAPTNNPFGTGFLTKIDPSVNGANSLVYSTYLGGTGGDTGQSIAADANGNAYVVGITFSADFPQLNALPNPLGLPTVNGSAFVTRIDTTKSGKPSLIYSTFLGGNGANGGPASFEGFGDFAMGVDVDGSNNAYVTGITTSTGMTFPTTTGTLQASADVNNMEGGAFFSKINTAGSGQPSLVYSTYLEGNVLDEGNAIAIGPGGVAYITGDTSSTNFPTTNTTSTAKLANAGVFPSAPSGPGVVFLTLIDPSKTNVAMPKYSVLLGGTNSSDIGHGVRVDSSGNAYLAGGASSTDFPITFGALELARLNPTGNAFVAKINPAGNGTADLLYASYFGGSGPNGGMSPDVGLGIAIDSATPPNAFITGQTVSTTAQGFPVTTGAFQNQLNGTSDAFVAKLTLEPTVSVSPLSINFGNVVVGTTSTPQTVTITNNTAVTVNFTGTPFTFTGTNPGDFAAAAPAAAVNGVNPCGANVTAGASCAENLTFTPAAGPAPLPGAESATLNVNDSDASSPQTVALTGTGTVPPPNFTVTAPAAVTVTQGGSKTFTVTVTPVSGFNQTVTLSCSDLPAFTTCTPMPAMVALADGKTAQMSMVTIDTSVAPMVASPAPAVPIIPPMVGAIALALCAIAMLVSASARRFRIPLALGVLVTLFFVAGCSHRHHTTPTGTTNIMITGTAGNIMNSTQVMLTVTAP